MIAYTIDPDAAYCWRCGVRLLGLMLGNGSGNGYSYGTGWAVGDGFGNGGGDGDGNGYGCGDHLPLCDDSLACACRQAQGPA